MKVVSYLLLSMMLFFTFLTWHSANCDPNIKFIDRDTYSINSQLAEIKISESKTNHDIKIISKNNTEILVEENKHPQCVSDCGCFGDALKGSVGRSLTPSESFGKDLILVYLVIWIFLAQWKTKSNSIKQNIWFLFSSLILVLILSLLFGWYFPILFALVSILGGLWMKQAGGKYLSNSLGSALFVGGISLLLISYVLMYEPIKDFRPYSVGSNMRWKMTDGIKGKYETYLKYKNLKTGQIKEFSSSSNEYIQSKIWEKKNWKYQSSYQKTIVESKLPSITEQFNPFIALNDITNDELKIPFIKSIVNKKASLVIKLRYVSDSSNVIEVDSEKYNLTDYPESNYEIIDRNSIK
jgi:hypothetical protein